MNTFDIIPASDVIHHELPNKDLLYISYEKSIPNVYRGMHFSVSYDAQGNIKIDSSKSQIPDPSTIYVYLPIAEGDSEPLSYYPHYIEMTPQQRYHYLCWLRDVTQPVDMGYVFIYYYGLEKQMLTGNFDKAFDEIVKLRNAHLNRSFQSYSENALIHAAIMTGRTDRLIDLHERTEISGYNNAMFLVAYKNNIHLGADNLILIFRKATTLSRKAEKENKELLRECISSVLSVKYPNGMPIGGYDISKVKTRHENRFANYSFPPEVQSVEITDFYSCKPMMTDISDLFNEAYSLYKTKKKMLSTGKTEEEIAEALRQKNIRRYKKLLKDKLLTSAEFDLLMEYNTQCMQLSISKLNK